MGPLTIKPFLGGTRATLQLNSTEKDVCYSCYDKGNCTKYNCMKLRHFRNCRERRNLENILQLSSSILLKNVVNVERAEKHTQHFN